MSLLVQSVSDGGTSTSSVSLAPAADYFAARNLSIGGELSILYGSASSSGGGTTTTAGLKLALGGWVP